MVHMSPDHKMAVLATFLSLALVFVDPVTAGPIKYAGRAYG